MRARPRELELSSVQRGGGALERKQCCVGSALERINLFGARLRFFGREFRCRLGGRRHRCSNELANADSLPLREAGQLSLLFPSDQDRQPFGFHGLSLAITIHMVMSPDPGSKVVRSAGP